MIRLLRGTLRHLMALGVLALILVALLISALRFSLPLADGYRQEVAAVLSERLDRPVQVGALSLRLVRWWPRLRLDDVSVQAPDGGPDELRLRALELDLDPIGSLRAWSPAISALTLVGARLSVRRLLDGRVQIEGLTALQPRDPHVLERFLRGGRLSLRDSEIRLRDDWVPGALPWLAAVQLRLSNASGHHRLEMSARPVAPRGAGPEDCPADAQVRVLADLRGDGPDPSAWDGAIYLNLGAADLTALVPGSLLDPGVASSESVVVETWAQRKGGRLTEALARVAARGLRIEVPGNVPGGADAATALAHHEGPMVIDRVGGLLRLAPAGAAWEAGLRNIALTVDGVDLPALDLDLRLSDAGRLQHLDLVSGRLDLALVGRLSSVVPWTPPPNLAAFLAGHPRGQLTRSAVEVVIPEEAPVRWRASARVEGLGFDRFGRIPRIDGLSASLSADQDAGTLRLGSDALRLDLAPVFDRTLGLDQFSGVLGWRRGRDGTLRVNGLHLVLENQDLRARARFELDLPPAGDAGGPFLDLRASLEDGNGRHLREYLPVGIIHPDLVKWLTRAVVAGRVSRGDLALRGPLRHYPFRDHEGRFELVLNVTDGVLDYLEHWPPIESFVGRLHFLNQGLTIQADSGRLLNSTLSAGEASIPDLWGPRRMKIHGESDGPLSDGLRILGETPLAKDFGRLAQALEVAGGSRLELDLGIPLAPGEPLAVDGRLTWPGPAAIALKDTPLRLTDLGGALSFTLNTLTAESITALLWGHPVKLAIETRGGGDGAGAVTAIRAEGRTPVADLAAQVPSPLWTLVGGELGWQLETELRNADLRESSPRIGWRLASQLDGLVLDLPAPLGKTAAERRTLDLSGSLVPRRSLALAGKVGGVGLDLGLDLQGDAPSLEHVWVGLGSQPPASTPPGLALEGAVVDLDVKAWWDWWKGVAPRLNNASARVGSGVLAPGALGGGPIAVDLRIDRLRLGGIQLNDARVRGAPRDGGWDLHLDAEELAGRLTLPAPGAQSPVDLGLQRLDLAALVSPAESAPATTRTAGQVAVEEGLPALDLRVADLRWGEATLGRLDLVMRPEPGGLRIPKIELSGPGDTSLTGDASWVDGEGGGRSRLRLRIHSADTGPILKALDYTSALSRAPLDAEVRLEWPAPLSAFRLDSSRGQIELKVGAGRLLEVEPGVGRVLGFLNLGALSRRLSLDFTDLYQQGFAFERMDADIRVADGRAELRRFDIEGPASTIHIGGFTDLRARTFDQTVTVEPKIGSSVALATAVAGGPVAGVAVLLADKVAGGAIDKLGSFRYRVTGPWLNPDLQPLGWEPFSAPGSTAGGGAPPQGSASQHTQGPGSPPKAPETRDENLFLD